MLSKGFWLHLHAGDARLGGNRLVQLYQVGKVCVDDVYLVDIDLVYQVYLARGSRRSAMGIVAIVAVIDIHDRVEQLTSSLQWPPFAVALSSADVLLADLAYLVISKATGADRVLRQDHCPSPRRNGGGRWRSGSCSRFSGIASTGRLRFRRTVWLSTFSTAPEIIRFRHHRLAVFLLAGVDLFRHRREEADVGGTRGSGLSQRSKLNTTSSALNSSPLFHFTPFRRLKVQVLRSSEASHFSAR